MHQENCFQKHRGPIYTDVSHWCAGSLLAPFLSLRSQGKADAAQSHAVPEPGPGQVSMRLILGPPPACCTSAFQAAMYSTRLPDHALHHCSFSCVHLKVAFACTRMCELDLQVSMRTLSDSELAIAVYPTFSYNSLGGGGVATAREEGSIVHVTFDPSTLTIPDVNYRNTTFMGVPMAPPFSIAVKPKKLEVGAFMHSFIATSAELHSMPHLHCCASRTP